MTETRGVRRKVTGILGVKSWMVVSDSGDAGLQEIDKHSIMRRTGLPARDLRVLDPMLSHPSSILGRDRAIVVNLEHIKAIITAKQALMINSSNPFFLGFLQKLQARVVSSNNATPSQISSDMNPYYEAKCPLEGSPLLRSRNDSPNNPSQGVFEDSDTFQDMPKVDIKGSKVKTAEDDEPVALASAPKQLPFEFKALEACIESVCKCLEFETRTLEEEAYPALDELTSHISSLNLDRVRQIKNRLVALSGRVQKVADQLEQLLDDDNDMEEMYLTQKLDARQPSSEEEENKSSSDEDEDESSDEDKNHGSKPNVEELEMLLEAYFAQINGVSQKLSSLSDYVDDTEDYINIKLDDKRNQLLQVAVIFNTLNMILNAGIVVVGIFGMNIHIDLFDGQPHQFWATTSGTFGGCVILFLISVWWGKKRYLLSQ